MVTRLQQRYFDFGLFRVDAGRRLLLRRGEPVSLTPKAFDILLILILNRNRVIEKDELMKLGWPDTAVEENNLTRNISSLRKALEERPNEHRYILTIPGRGYQFAADVPTTTDGADSHVVFERRARSRVLIEEECESDSEIQSITNVSAPHKVWRAFGFWPVACAAGCALLVSSVWLYTSRLRHATLPPPRVVALTSLPDRAGCAAFSPDANHVAFARNSDSPELSGIYIKQIGSEQLLQLTHNERDLCPAWSPDGRYLAFSRYAEQEHFKYDEEHFIYLIAAVGGAERKLYSGPPSFPLLDWSPDGKVIAFSTAPPGHSSSSISLLTLETLATRKLTEPGVGNQDWAPVFSPDGKNLAFIRANGNHTKDELFVMAANGGEARRLTFDDASVSSSPAWARDGKSILFSSTRSGPMSIWRIPSSGGTPTQVLELGLKAEHPRIAGSGNRLTYEQQDGITSVWGLNLAAGKKNARKQVTASRGDNHAAELSPDRTRIVFVSNRTGSDQIYICNADGSDLLQLTNLGNGGTPGRPHWSPDGQKIVFDSVVKGHNTIFVIQANGGPPRPLMDERSSDNLNPTWSHNGRWIYFTSNRTGEWQIWRMPSDGGPALQLTQQGGFAAFESVDGNFVYYAKTSADPDIWKLRLQDRQETAVSPHLHVSQWTSWALADDCIFFVKEAADAHPTLRSLDLRTARITDITPLEKQPWPLWISASADGSFVIYGQTDMYLSNIMLVENFR
jgi:Tol biopolymer transport system component/DNA-binding winged helix-turn-helix (wHTH) protein